MFIQDMIARVRVIAILHTLHILVGLEVRRNEMDDKYVFLPAICSIASCWNPKDEVSCEPLRETAQENIRTVMSIPAMRIGT